MVAQVRFGDFGRAGDRDLIERLGQNELGRPDLVLGSDPAIGDRTVHHQRLASNGSIRQSRADDSSPGVDYGRHGATDDNTPGRVAIVRLRLAVGYRDRIDDPRAGPHNRVVQPRVADNGSGGDAGLVARQVARTGDLRVGRDLRSVHVGSETSLVDHGTCLALFDPCMLV